MNYNKYMNKLYICLTRSYSLDYAAIGPRYSNLALQTLLTLLKKRPPQVHVIHRRLRLP